MTKSNFNSRQTIQEISFPNSEKLFAKWVNQSVSPAQVKPNPKNKNWHMVQQEDTDIKNKREPEIRVKY